MILASSLQQEVNTSQAEILLYCSRLIKENQDWCYGDYFFLRHEAFKSRGSIKVILHHDLTLRGLLTFPAFIFRLYANIYCFREHFKWAGFSKGFTANPSDSVLDFKAISEFWFWSWNYFLAKYYSQFNQNAISSMKLKSVISWLGKKVAYHLIY